MHLLLPRVLNRRMIVLIFVVGVVGRATPGFFSNTLQYPSGMYSTMSGVYVIENSLPHA
jgi:hypothetical protein